MLGLVIWAVAAVVVAFLIFKKHYEAAAIVSAGFLLGKLSSHAEQGGAIWLVEWVNCTLAAGILCYGITVLFSCIAELKNNE